MADTSITSGDGNEYTDTTPEADLKAKVDEQVLFKRLQGWWKLDASARSKWEKQAEKDFAFVAGDQWTDDEEKQMQDREQVPVAFNRVLSIIKAVCGSEINGRQDIIFLPRHTDVGASRQNELLTQTSQWMGDLCDAEDEESEAFEAATICGMGWTESRISYDEDPAGLYDEKEVDPREMFWDNKARKKNLADARRVARVRDVSLGEARAMFPGVPDSDLDAVWARTSAAGQTKPVEDKRHQDDNFGYGDGDDQRNEVTLVHMQWFEKEPYWLVADPQSNETSIMEKEQFERLSERSQDLSVDFPSVKLLRKVYKQAFLGSKILEQGPTPVPNQFSYQCITGERDRKNNTWFGLVKPMRDPQMWANKMLSNALHISNTTAKGGIIAEKNAFDDERQAEESYAQPNAITFAAEGAVKDGRIMAKPGAGDPGVYLRILEFAVSSIRDVTGVNLELLGMREAEQPGILEAQRKQAAMTVLAGLFNSLRRFRKQIGRIRLHYIQNSFSDGRLIRVVGVDGAQSIPLMHDQTSGEYDVVVSDAPTSPNQKEANWAIISQMLPSFKDMLTAAGPDAILEILRFSPLPSEFVEKLKSLQAARAPQDQRQAQQHQELLNAQLSAIQAKASRDQAAAQKDSAQAGAVGLDGATNQAVAQAGVVEAQARAQHAQAGATKAAMDAHIASVHADSASREADSKGEAHDARAMHDRARALRTLHEVGVAQSDAESASTVNDALIRKTIAETARIMAETMDQKFDTMLKMMTIKEHGVPPPGPAKLSQSERL